MATPLAIYVVAVQYSRNNDPVTFAFRARDVIPNGLFQTTTLYSSTQTALIARIPADIAATVGNRWGDAESDAELLAMLAANGITAIIVEPTS